MKKFILGILTLALLVYLNYVASNMFNVDFVELSFPVGLSCTFVLGFLSTEGDFSSRFANWQVGSCVDKTVRNHYFTKLHISTPLLVCILYTLISAIASIIIFWKYF